jgi:hypothetical protein
MFDLLICVCNRPEHRVKYVPFDDIQQLMPSIHLSTAATHWLRCCAMNRKVAGSSPDGVIGIFH